MRGPPACCRQHPYPNLKPSCVLQAAPRPRPASILRASGSAPPSPCLHAPLLGLSARSPAAPVQLDGVSNPNPSPNPAPNAVGRRLCGEPLPHVSLAGLPVRPGHSHTHPAAACRLPCGGRALGRGAEAEAGLTARAAAEAGRANHCRLSGRDPAACRLRYYRLRYSPRCCGLRWWCALAAVRHHLLAAVRLAPR